MGVLAIWRYPVKAMLGELLHAVEIGPGGCGGDRRWAVVDSVTGERIANKRGPTHPALRACRAELLEATGEALPLRITLPDGATLTGSEIQEALCELLGRAVHLEEFAGPAEGALGAPAAHHDFAPVHVMTTSTLAHLRSMAAQSDFDARRFRPNLLLDDGAEPGAFGEDALIGRSLRAPSGCELRVDLPTPRCVVPTRAHEELPADPLILRTIARGHRVDLGPFGRHACAGAYAEVVNAGAVRVGDRLAVGPARTAPREALDATIARLTSA
jgi:uncharacterized protein YcbX